MDKHLSSFFNAVSVAKESKDSPESPKEEPIKESIEIKKPEPLNEIEVLKNIIKNNKDNILDILLSIPELANIIQRKETITEVVQPVPSIPNIDNFIKKKDIIEEEQNKYADRFKFLENEISKVASNISGGGAGDVLSLTHPVKTISSSTYTVGRRDYYIGVNYNGAVTITLPNSYSGRNIIIKDESGLAFNNPITINGTIDNSTSVTLQVNNGTLQFIYNNGWKII